jgi:arylsulfatase A-like enzyme/Tfp pilus assembly protein PilF
MAGCRNSEPENAGFVWRGAPVIIIAVDTLRADHLPAYGYDGVTTPAIDALRRNSILFENAYAHAPLTLPSHASLLTGLRPTSHEVRNNLGYRLDERFPTIPTMLRSGGYQSGAAVSAYVLRASTGFGRSFDFFDDGIVSRNNVAIGALMRSGAQTSAIAKQWIAARKNRPFFFLLHLFEPHSPYAAPPAFRSRARLAYDQEIAYVDAIIGDFIGFLQREGIFDKAMIVLLSDHGEGLDQHGEKEHGIFLYREAIHVPLLVKLPGATRGGETASHPVGLIDVLPTIAEVTGMPAPDRVQGRSLLHTDSTSESRNIYSETYYPRIHLGWSALRSLAGSRHHFIDAPRPELYDVREDPEETKNILAESRRVYARLRTEMETFGTHVELPSTMDPEEARKLAALGYLSATTTPASSEPLRDPKDGMPELSAMMHAMALVRDDDHAGAVVELRRIVAGNPRLSDAWMQMGASLEALGRYDDAIAAYRSALGVQPALSGELALRVAGALTRLDRLDDAAEHARLAEKVNYGGAHLILAEIALKRRELERAESEARLAMRDNHTDIQAKVMLARIYSQQERAREALAIAREAEADAKERQSGPVELLYFVIGDALARIGEYAPAEQALQQEIARFPHHLQAYASLYLVRALMNRQDDANAALESMVRANRSRAAYARAAEATAAVGDERAAVQWRRRAAAAGRE